MAITTSQQISTWFEVYKSIDVTYTKEIIKTSGLDARNVFLKCVGEQWPCVIYTSSFLGAKIVASAKQALLERIKKANGSVSLRFSFKLEGKADPLSFFVAARTVGFAPYSGGGSDLQFISLQYTQRPPDDLIEILGRILDANINSARRREDRILLTVDSMRKLGLMTRDSIIYVQGVPRKCILRDLSFGGLKVIIVGLAKFLVGKDCSIRLDLDEPRETIEIKGKVVRFEDVEGRKDLTAVAIKFEESSIPMSYKIHVNEYLGQARQSRTEEEGDQGQGGGSAPGGGGAGLVRGGMVYGSIR
jgi:hypothetical protein